MSRLLRVFVYKNTLNHPKSLKNECLICVEKIWKKKYKIFHKLLLGRTNLVFHKASRVDATGSRRKCTSNQCVRIEPLGVYFECYFLSCLILSRRVHISRFCSFLEFQNIFLIYYYFIRFRHLKNQF